MQAHITTHDASQNSTSARNKNRPQDMFHIFLPSTSLRGFYNKYHVKEQSRKEPQTTLISLQKYNHCRENMQYFTTILNYHQVPTGPLRPFSPFTLTHAHLSSQSRLNLVCLVHRPINREDTAGKKNTKSPGGTRGRGHLILLLQQIPTTSMSSVSH